MSAAYEKDRALVQWSLAVKAIELICYNPDALGGLVLHGFHGPVRERLLEYLGVKARVMRLPANSTVESLEGGIDTPATLAAGKLVHRPGLLEQAAGGILLIPAAERLDTSVSGSLARWLDARSDASATTVLIALDESLADSPSVIDNSLGERMALHVPVPDLALKDLPTITDTMHMMERSKGFSVAHVPASLHLSDELLAQITTLAASLGIASLRTTIQACRAARSCAALDARADVTIDDTAIAAQLVLASRALQLPESAPEEPSKEPAEEPPADENDEETDEPQQQQPEEEPTDSEISPDEDPDNETDENPDDEPDASQERLIDSVAAALPRDILNALISRQSQAQSRSGNDAARTQSRGNRGRPTGVRRPRGDLHRERLDLPSTLKMAIPRQRLRPAAKSGRLSVRMDDLRVRRYRQSTRTTTLFVVDASGSAAMHRLAEAKGAVENLLAECYVRRDQVALITFRGTEATLDLPPTRSLVRARRRLAGLPGGGGTPLAAGLDLANQLIRQLQQAGESPMAIFMTDAKANIARDGTASRMQAQTDAEQSARLLAETGARLLFVDTATRPRPIAARLAEVMHARYLPLPQLDTTRLPSAYTPTSVTSR